MWNCVVFDQPQVTVAPTPTVTSAGEKRKTLLSTTPMLALCGSEGAAVGGTGVGCDTGVDCCAAFVGVGEAPAVALAAAVGDATAVGVLLLDAAVEGDTEAEPEAVTEAADFVAAEPGVVPESSSPPQAAMAAPMAIATNTTHTVLNPFTLSSPSTEYAARVN